MFRCRPGRVLRVEASRATRQRHGQRGREVVFRLEHRKGLHSACGTPFSFDERVLRGTLGNLGVAR